MVKSTKDRYLMRAASAACFTLCQALDILQRDAKEREQNFRVLYLLSVQYELKEAQRKLGDSSLGLYAQRLTAFAQDHFSIAYRLKALQPIAKVTAPKQNSCGYDHFHADFEKLNRRKNRVSELFIARANEYLMAFESVYDVLLQFVPIDSRSKNIFKKFERPEGYEGILKICRPKDMGWDEDNVDHRQVIMGEGMYFNYEENSSGMREEASDKDQDQDQDNDKDNTEGDGDDKKS